MKMSHQLCVHAVATHKCILHFFVFFFLDVVQQQQQHGGLCVVNEIISHKVNS